MGNDPNSSVVNEWGGSHYVLNVFIIDGSILVPVRFSPIEFS
jgi:choline dehydrogenase-like flavoprotein